MPRKKHQRLSHIDKQQIKQLTLEGKSLRQISKLMDLGITTIYYQIKKFKPKQKKDFEVNLSEKEIGELIGGLCW